MKHLVIIGMVVPEPASTAAGHRMLQLLEMFRSWDFKLSECNSDFGYRRFTFFKKRSSNRI